MKIYKCIVANSTEVRNLYPLKGEGRGSEAQLQVGENLNKLTVVM